MSTIIPVKDNVYKFDELYKLLDDKYNKLDPHVIEFVAKLGPYCKLPFALTGTYRGGRAKSYEAFVIANKGNEALLKHASEFNPYWDSINKAGTGIHVYEFNWSKFRLRNGLLEMSRGQHTNTGMRWQAWTSKKDGWNRVPHDEFLGNISRFWGVLRRRCLTQHNNVITSETSPAAIKHTNAYMRLGVSFKELEEEMDSVRRLIDSESITQKDLDKFRDVLKTTVDTVSQQKKVFPLWK